MLTYIHTDKHTRMHARTDARAHTIAHIVMCFVDIRDAHILFAT